MQPFRPVGRLFRWSPTPRTGSLTVLGSGCGDLDTATRAHYQRKKSRDGLSRLVKAGYVKDQAACSLPRSRERSFWPIVSGLSKPVPGAGASCTHEKAKQIIFEVNQTWRAPVVAVSGRQAVGGGCEVKLRTDELWLVPCRPAAAGDRSPQSILDQSLASGHGGGRCGAG
jgi:hypothetical protein